MAPEFNTDICVIGAGPAGCTIAKRLAELGHLVTIVEAQPFPRQHVGICLSDETYSLLDYLGVGPEVRNAGFLERQTTVVKWDKKEPQKTQQPGIHVDRGVFDRILLDHARAAGVKVLQPAHVRAVKPIPRGGWQLRVGKENSDLFTSRFLVDASGQSSIFPSKKIKAGPSLFALHAYWELERRPEYDGFIEAGIDAWLWFALTKEKQCLITLFTDPKHFSQSKSASIEGHYKKLIHQFSLMKHAPLIKRDSEVVGCDATSRYTTDPIGKDYIRVGDANFSVDPMASQGVHLAIASGVQAAVVVNTLVRFPNHTKAAISFYRSRQKERVKQFTEKTEKVYRQVAKNNSTDFWIDRAGTLIIPERPSRKRVNALPCSTQKVQLSSLASIETTPVMRDRYIENAKALLHPSLPRPVAFLGGEDLVQLIGHIQPGHSLENIQAEWSDIVPYEMKSKILNWMWEREIIVPFEAAKTQKEQILQHSNKIIAT